MSDNIIRGQKSCTTFVWYEGATVCKISIMECDILNNYMPQHVCIYFGVTLVNILKTLENKILYVPCELRG